MGSASRTGAELRVLVVEDEPLIALDVEEMLTRMGCLVIGPVPTVARAMELLQREQLDFAILDVDLRRERATPIAEALQALDVPYGLASACDRSQLSDEPLREVPLLGKPIDQRRVQDALTDLAKRGVGSVRSLDLQPDTPEPDHIPSEVKTRLLLARNRYDEIRRDLDLRCDIDRDLHAELTRTLRIIDRKIVECGEF